MPGARGLETARAATVSQIERSVNADANNRGTHVHEERERERYLVGHHEVVVIEVVKMAPKTPRHNPEFSQGISNWFSV